MHTAKITTNGTHQIIILPPELHITSPEVYIKQIGNTMILIDPQNPWQTLFDSLDQFSEDFMTTREQPPLDTRESF